MGSTISFNGVSSETCNVYIEQEPDRPYPEKVVEKSDIPGRNGTLYLDTGMYKNVTLEYSISVYNPSLVTGGQTLTSKLSENLIKWLHPGKGYFRLSDSYDPNHYRMAMCKNSDKVELLLKQVGNAKIKFECLPQVYLTSGETLQTIAAGVMSATFNNTTGNDASPIINIPSTLDAAIENVNITFSCAGYENQVLKIFGGSPAFTLDCESLDAWRMENGKKVSCVSYLKFDSDIPVFHPGTTTITLGVALPGALTYKPNTWVL